MKKLALILAALLVALTALFAFAACNNDDGTDAPALTMLSASGKDIVDESGAKVALRGTNFGGWLVQESWMCPTKQDDSLSTAMTLYARFGRENAEALISAYQDNWITETDFARVKELGLNVVRIPFTYMNFYNYLSDDGGLLSPDQFTLRADAFARLDWALEMCEKYGLYAILDMHGAVGSQNGNDHSGDTRLTNLYEDSAAGEAYRAKTAELWGLIAEHFEGNPYVAGYDLLNEPGRASGKTQWDYYDVLYDAVRAKDADHMIFIEAVWEPGHLPVPSAYGWENVVYEYHHYNWDYNKMANALFYSLKRAAESLSDNGVPVLVGEFNAWGDSRRGGVGDTDQTDFDAIAGVLELYNGEGWHWTTWTYKVTVDGPDENSTWGLYNCYIGLTDAAKADPATYSYDDIMQAWTSCSTADSFVLYDDFADIVKEYAAAPFAAGEPSGGYAILA